ncbi:MAG TPA: MFS transporter, partial [Ferruginibacter sp.]|nr:MFS transporter [Ferruginibacter sp.]
MSRVLPVIVISQFFCTSLWFAGNAIIADIIKEFHLTPGFLAHLTSAVQFGFISGTLIFAVLAISDRFSPSKVFFASSVIAAIFNLGIIIVIHPTGLLAFRFFTGFFLAGIYPVGMKIASDYYKEGLGKSMGFLVGALVIGTALPHLIKSFTTTLPWKVVIFSTSLLSVTGGLIMLLLKDGPYRKPGQEINFSSFFSGFRNKHFRAAAFGYFGHMWELYAFWAFVPVILSMYTLQKPGTGLNVSLLSFFIIASGGVACVLSGYLSLRFGAKKVATVSLFLSGLCCIISPLFINSFSPFVLVIFLFLWGLVVIADSPLFSTLVAQNAPAESRGTSLTIVNCIGFSITIISIQLINLLSKNISSQYVYTILSFGPLLGLIALFTNKSTQKSVLR